MEKWGMVIDLRKCINCKGCEVVCSQTNSVPNKSRRKVFEFETDSDDLIVYLPMSCMQCSEPPCLDACPTTATHQRPDGIVDINADLCVGCGYCVVSCPYDARTIVDGKAVNFMSFDAKADYQAYESIMGICTKCNLCADKIDQGLQLGLVPGRDKEATPSCINTCPSNALYFGDLNDSDCEINKLLEEENCEALHEEMGTEPSIFYILPDGYSFKPM